MKVYVPLDAAARALGADEVVVALQAEAARRGIALNVTRIGSRGMVWLEPLVELETAEGRVGFGPMTAGEVAQVFDGGPLALGPVEDLPWMKAQTRLTFARCGVIDPLSVEDYRAHGGFAGLSRALTMTVEERLAEVTASGLRGRGVAGFPTGMKWRTVAGAVADRKYIVCNADEGDSGTFADRMIMEGDPFSVIEGMAIAGITVGATKGFVYLRSEYPDAIAVMNRAVELARLAGYLGSSVAGSGLAFDMKIRVGAGAYVCGEETSLLNSLEGKRGVVRAKPPLPALEGFMGRPTVVNNVISLATIPVIFEREATVPSISLSRACCTPSPETSRVADCSRRPLACPWARLLMIWRAARPPGARSRLCRWAVLWAPISRGPGLTCLSAMRNIPVRAG